MPHLKSINAIYGKNMIFGRLLSSKQPTRKWLSSQNKKGKQVLKRYFAKKISSLVNLLLFVTTW